MGTRGSFPEGKAGVKLTTHLHLVPMSRIRGAIPPLPQYVFTACCLVKHGDNFTLPLQLESIHRRSLKWSSSNHFSDLSGIFRSLYCLGYRLTSGVRFPAGSGSFFLVTTFRPALRTGDFYPGSKAAGVWSCRSIQSSDEVKNVWSYTSTPPIRLRGVVLN
jgi:hypothetical protein